VFAGPGEYPPEDFAAYGILAFRSAVTAQSRPRYLAICEGFIAALPAASTLASRGVALEEQMATVWPLDDAPTARSLNSGQDTSGRCDRAVSSIDIVVSRDAIAKARRSRPNADFTSQGPYVIAWSPSATVGQPGAAVLVWNLSSVTTVEGATRQFSDWAIEIERNPELWRNGWNTTGLRTVIRNWADRWGPSILELLGG
jgi:hypothetical protein